MKNLNRKPVIIFLIIFILILLGGIIALAIASKPMPVGLIQEYGIGLLWEEGKVMNACAECHNAIDFHDCTTCHDDHGAVELAGVKFYEVVELTGDVPEHNFIRVNEVFSNQTNVGTHVLLFDFLSQQGVEDFESITFITNDGGLATIKAQYLDETAMLVPYVDGVRFVTESVHVSSWLMGIKQIIVVGIEKPLTIDGKATSIGRLLLGDTMRLTVEGSDTMLTDEAGRTGLAFVGNWVEGARLLPLLKTPLPNRVTITNRNGGQVELAGDEIEDAILAIVRKEITLVLPDRGRSAWPSDIVQIDSK